MDNFHTMIKMIDGRQTQGPIILTLNLRDQNNELCQSHGPFD